MSRRNTKELIMYTALRLFSDKGFDGVGLREIAAEIGIRESAIYRHYQSKQDLFDTIILTQNDRLDQETKPFEISARNGPMPQSADGPETLYRIGLQMFRNYLFDEHGAQLRRMLTIEQVKDSAAGQDFSKRLIEDKLDYITATFETLIEQGCYRSSDPQLMALQFYSPLYLLLLRFDRQPACTQEVLNCLDSHIREFDAMYKTQENTTLK